IISAVQSQGFDYEVIKHLLPAGDVWVNAKLTARQIRDWYQRNFPNHDEPITLLGHSIGGAYALGALQFLGDLPIKNVIMVLTPLDGVPLANKFLTNRISRSLIWAIDHASAGIFDFRGLVDV